MGRAWRTMLGLWRVLRSGNWRFLTEYPPGHYYSPIPDHATATAGEGVLESGTVRDLRSVDLKERAQVALLEQFEAYYGGLPFQEQPNEGSRFHLDNSWFGYGDSVILYCFLRHFQPRRIIEVGSGYSSAAMLDVNSECLEHRVEFTFIDPNPERLLSLVHDQDRNEHRLIRSPVQEVPTDGFASLEEDDILFVDSSHVAKHGSDVLYLITQVLPSLRKGVIVHFHDVPWPFDYPVEWFREGRAWNEAYFLRAFLQYNRAFEILFFNSFLEVHHRDLMEQRLPLALRRPSASLMPSNSSLWLRKTCDS